MPIRLILGRGVQRSEVLPHTRAAAAFWRRHGVRLVSRGIEAGGPDEVLGGDAVALDRRTVGLDAAAAEAAVLDATLAPLRGWLAGRQDAGAIELVAVRRIAARRSPVLRVSGPPAGLTIGPDLVLDGALGEALRAETAGRPTTAFVSLDALAAMPPERARWVVAHELGHALGLPHDADPTNLMAPEPGPCTPQLRPDQRSELR